MPESCMPLQSHWRLRGDMITGGEGPRHPPRREGELVGWASEPLPGRAHLDNLVKPLVLGDLEVVLLGD